MNANELLGVRQEATREEIRRAYRSLAARWHPDRFSEGPERDWANEKMAEINRAYHELLNRPPEMLRSDTDTEMLLKKIRVLTEGGHSRAARSLLMQIKERPPEWNYLFGRVLLLENDPQKALIYLRIAARQAPKNEEYRLELLRAEGRPSGLGHLKAKINHILKK